MGYYWPFGFPNWVKPQLDRIEAKLDEVIQREIAMAGELDALESQVAAENTVIDSAITLLAGLKASLDEAIANNDMSRVAAITAAIGAKQQALADAITTNTPAAP